MVVAPVVVSPETASNMAWVSARRGSASMNGIEATAAASSHAKVVMKKPSRSRSS